MLSYFVTDVMTIGSVGLKNLFMEAGPLRDLLHIKFHHLGLQLLGRADDHHHKLVEQGLGRAGVGADQLLFPGVRSKKAHLLTKIELNDVQLCHLDRFPGRW